MGRNSEAYCAGVERIGAEIGAIRLSPIAPYMVCALHGSSQPE
jgi:hypothetical protein